MEDIRYRILFKKGPEIGPVIKPTGVDEANWEAHRQETTHLSSPEQIATSSTAEIVVAPDASK